MSTTKPHSPSILPGRYPPYLTAHCLYAAIISIRPDNTASAQDPSVGITVAPGGASLPHEGRCPSPDWGYNHSWRHLYSTGQRLLLHVSQRLVVTYSSYLYEILSILCTTSHSKDNVNYLSHI